LAKYFYHKPKKWISSLVEVINSPSLVLELFKFFQGELAYKQSSSCMNRFGKGSKLSLGTNS